jgi:putative transposase
MRAPNMNAVCERFPGSLRREGLDPSLVLDGGHFQRVIAKYVREHNAARAQQGPISGPVPAPEPAGRDIVAHLGLSSLPHEMRRVRRSAAASSHGSVK